MYFNPILLTDSYKLTHWNQYPSDTEAVYSYFESRTGAQFDRTVFFGLQSLIMTHLRDTVVFSEDVEEAAQYAEKHFGDAKLFNYDGWMHIAEDHQGRLPLHIKAVPEGTIVPVSNVMMTVENTCPKCFWLTNALESLLTHVWYASTVATLSYHVKKNIELVLSQTADDLSALPFMLHDFGFRGTSSVESAAIGGLAHLINFMGTDTLPALILGAEHYCADLNTLGFSVPATEHSVMTAEGEGGEMRIVKRLIADHPTGILSVVADSYNYYRFVQSMGSYFKESILAREGRFVIRPDSVTPEHDTPEKLVVWTLQSLWDSFGGRTNTKLYKVLDDHVRVLWGDGIDPRGIQKILIAAQNAGFSAENLVFGMGGGLLQKLNRDTQRFAFKCSARKANGKWINVQKNPLDRSKKSKAGRLALIPWNGTMKTVDQGLAGSNNLLQEVFDNGEMTRYQTFEDIRKIAAEW